MLAGSHSWSKFADKEYAKAATGKATPENIDEIVRDRGAAKIEAGEAFARHRAHLVQRHGFRLSLAQRALFFQPVPDLVVNRLSGRIRRRSL